jgi:hypothetical protein
MRPLLVLLLIAALFRASPTLLPPMGGMCVDETVTGERIDQWVAGLGDLPPLDDDDEDGSPCWLLTPLDEEDTHPEALDRPGYQVWVRALALPPELARRRDGATSSLGRPPRA